MRRIGIMRSFMRRSDEAKTHRFMAHRSISMATIESRVYDADDHSMRCLPWLIWTHESLTTERSQCTQSSNVHRC